MKNSNFVKNSILALLPISLILGVFFGVQNKPSSQANAYEYTKLTTLDINLNDTTKDCIREYYSGLNSLAESNRKGTNLLKNLKPILRNNQKYFSYDNNLGKDSIWRLYEIVDRDWVKSPASSVKNGTYDSGSNTIIGYVFGKTEDEYDPYVHALYVDRSFDNQTRAWKDHTQTFWGINQEHIWPKSHGFDDTTGIESKNTGGARGDPMHLWAGNGYANNIHSNDYYGYVDKTKEYKNVRDTYEFLGDNYTGVSKTVGSGRVFEPQDSDKGDIARAVFYMAARYNNYAAESDINVNEPNLILDNSINTNTGTSTKDNPFDLGVLSDLLEWNKIDPPDEFEIHRNNLLFNNFTNNRNPFIDFPDWADICFGASSKAADPTKDDINGKKDGEVVLSSISLSGNYKTRFNLGDEFSCDGLVVTARYSDNTAKTLSSYNINGYNKNQEGEQTITVSYTENSVTKSTTYKVIVSKPVVVVELTSITLSGNYKTEFKVGEEFSSSGLIVTAHYSDDTSKEVTPTSIKGYKKDSKGEQTITVLYEENGKSASTTYKVNVKEESKLKTVIIVGCIIGAAFLSILSTTVSIKKKRKKGKRKNGRK